MTIQEYQIWNALELFLKRFRVYIVKQLDPENKGDWEPVFRDSLVYKKYKDFNPNISKFYRKQNGWINAIRGKKKDEIIEEIDYHHLEVFTDNQKEILKNTFHNDAYHLSTWLYEIALVRHKIAHFKKVSRTNIITAWDYIERISGVIDDPEFQKSLKSIKTKIEKEENKNKWKIISIIIAFLFLIGVAIISFVFIKNKHIGGVKTDSLKTNIPIKNNISNLASDNALAKNDNFESKNAISKKDASTSLKQYDEDYSIYVNSSFANTKDNIEVSVIILDSANSIENNISSSIAVIYSNAGMKGNIGLIKSKFIKMPEFQDLLDGNPDIIEILKLNKYTDYLAIGQITFSYEQDKDNKDKIYCYASINMNIISTSKKPKSSFSIQVTGNGASKKQAQEYALRNLLGKHSLFKI